MTLKTITDFQGGTLGKKKKLKIQGGTLGKFEKIKSHGGDPWVKRFSRIFKVFIEAAAPKRRAGYNLHRRANT